MYGKAVRSTVLTPSNSISQHHHTYAELQHEFAIVCAVAFGSEREKWLVTAGCPELVPNVDIENKICTSSEGKNLFKMTARRRLHTKQDFSAVIHQLS